MRRNGKSYVLIGLIILIYVLIIWADPDQGTHL